MVVKYILSAVCASVMLTSLNASADIVSVDWQANGDNLITRDTVSGLDWLDLTETNQLTRDQVVAQLGAGGQFEGWRYATNVEVVALWSELNVDLYAPVAYNYADQNILAATQLIGNTMYEADPNWNGAFGYTAKVTGSTFSQAGAYYNNVDRSYYYADQNILSTAQELNRVKAGSYLVKLSEVPVPAAVWLFASGLIGLFGVAKRKIYT